MPSVHLFDGEFTISLDSENASTDYLLELATEALDRRRSTGQWSEPTDVSDGV